MKSHKEGNPLLPIISQTPVPTYALAKRLHKILCPYIPFRNCVTSSVEFLEIRDSSGVGTMASLDVESLFTNVPVDETIGIIMEWVYRNHDMRPPNLQEDSLRTLLDICTMNTPFTTHRGQMYHQEDGVAMGSPLGILFANFYMGEVEERVFSQHRCPRTYRRYIDNIFVQADSEDEVEAIQQQILRHSALNFTVEYSSNDVLVMKTNQKLATTVYTKATNLRLCLNGDRECPVWFKTTTVRAFVRRALSHCSTWQDTHLELDRASQMLINNGYSIKLVN
ncbi:uncharacterized protein LOC135208085 [Macrobrachium nipponense]